MVLFRRLQKCSSAYSGTDGIYGVDPLRLTLVSDSLGMSGFALDDLLQRDFGVCAEMSTDKVPPTYQISQAKIPLSLFCFLLSPHDHPYLATSPRSFFRPAESSSLASSC